MSPKEKIAKLEGLLARVKERAEAPRPRGAGAFPPAHAAEVVHAESEPEPVVASPPTAPPPASRAGTVPPVSAPPDASGGWSETPPIAAAEPAPETSFEQDADLDADVEVSAEVVEVDIDIDEPGMMPAESGAQLVAAEVTTNGAAELEEVHDETPEETGVTVEATEEEIPEELLAGGSIPPADDAEPAPPPANELVEPAPSSSPRPIASEQPEPYEAQSAPRHTPPPESGKQVAAPSAKPEPARSSTPPASLEGHTLIGGWREPGTFLKGGAPAVRVPPAPPPPAAPPADSAPPAPPSAPPAPVAAKLEPQAPVEARGPLTATATKPELPDVQVATFTGTVPTFTPATFGDLLDATLAL